MNKKLKSLITLLEAESGKKVMLEFVDDRENQLFTQAGNKVSDSMNILLGDLQEMENVAENDEDEDFMVQLSVIQDQINDFQNKLTSKLSGQNSDSIEDLDEASILDNNKTSGTVDMTTDQIIKNKDGAVKKLTQNKFSVRPTDLK